MLFLFAKNVTIVFGKYLKWLEGLSNSWLIMNDLLLEANNSTFQIDSIVISPDTIYLFEIKNYEGDFYIKDDKWFTISGKEIKNPLLQLKRAESLFRRLLQDLRFSFSIEGYVVFVNPNFFVYQAPLNLPFIFPNQIQRFIKNINLRSPKQTTKTTRFVEILSSVLLKEIIIYLSIRMSNCKKGLLVRVVMRLLQGLIETICFVKSAEKQKRLNLLFCKASKNINYFFPII